MTILDRSAGGLPYPFESLAEDRETALEMLDEVDATSNGVVRADLASEVAAHLARYENAKTDVVYPLLYDALGEAPELEEARRYEHGLRAALVEIHERTRHVKPMNAHAGDPAGLERAIDALVSAARAEFLHDDQALLPLVRRLPERSQFELAERLPKAVEHASTHPLPPRTPIQRIVREVSERLERKLSEQSTPYHPGIDRVATHEGPGRDGSEGEPGSH